MRTTLVIQDDLLAEVKKRAAERKSNVSAIVNEALREAIKRDQKRSPVCAFEMPTFRPSKRAPATDTSPAELQDLIAAEDAEAYRT